MLMTGPHCLSLYPRYFLPEGSWREPEHVLSVRRAERGVRSQWPRPGYSRCGEILIFACLNFIGCSFVSGEVSLMYQKFITCLPDVSPTSSLNERQRGCLILK